MSRATLGPTGKIFALTATLVVSAAILVQSPGEPGSIPQAAAITPARDEPAPVSSPSATSPQPPPTLSATAPPPTGQDQDSPPGTSARTRRVYDPADLDDAPKEPLTPPEARVEAVPAPRSAVTAEPLLAPEIVLDAPTSTRGAPAGDAPLTPPVMRAEDLKDATDDPWSLSP